MYAQLEAASVTVNIWSPTWMVPLRAAPNVFGAMVKFTVPFVPEYGLEVTVIQLLKLCSANAQPGTDVVKLNEPPPPNSLEEKPGVPSPIVHAAATCVTGKLILAMVRVVDRSRPVVLGSTV